MFLAMGRTKFGGVVYGVGNSAETARLQIEALCSQLSVYHYIGATSLTISGGEVVSDAVSVVIVP